jgi:hypothetical protein
MTYYIDTDKYIDNLLVVVDPELTCVAPENNYTTCKA